MILCSCKKILKINIMHAQYQKHGFTPCISFTNLNQSNNILQTIIYCHQTKLKHIIYYCHVNLQAIYFLLLSHKVTGYNVLLSR